MSGKDRIQKRKAVSLKIKIGCLMSICIILILAVVIYKRFAPVSQKMSAYDYFDISHDTDKVMVMVDDKKDNDIGISIDGSVYLPQDYVADNINVRFYYDIENKAVFYTDSEKTYIFTPDNTSVTDTDGNSYTTEVPIVKLIDGKAYLNFEYVAKYTNISYVYIKDPDRLIIDRLNERKCVTVKKDTQVRYRGGIKSKVLENVSSGDLLTYISTVDDWMQVRTQSGFTGYIKASKVDADITDVIPQQTYSDNYKHNLKQNKINMAWFQTTSQAGNAQISNYLKDAKGLNTISPTWYSISDSDGNMSNISSADFVKSMHAGNIEVWPLINDFDKNVDYKQLYSSCSKRKKMIDIIINDAVRYGYDGINIDFENVKPEFSKDFLQFIRELSIRCHENNILLSTDNYKKESYNEYYNLKEQASFADYIIIMGYDEHYSGSDAGSVASIKFVEEGIKDITSEIPGEQVINAIPFYTRIWTINGTETTCKSAGMQDAADFIKSNGASYSWDEATGQNYCEFSKDGSTVKIWLEDDKSLETKMKLYSKYKLAGVAEWKLGFETPSVWDIIDQNLKY